MPLRFTLVYFHSEAQLDTDNIIKPVQDALKGITYSDDRQVTDVFAARRELTGRFGIATMTPRLAGAITMGQTFLYVRLLPV